MSKIVPKLHDSELPGLEADLEPKPEWEPRYPGSGRLDRKVAIVTGGDSGIGRAVAVLFAREEDTPMGRPGQPNEVAPCFLFLACADSRYMSGQVLHPNGGVVVGS